MEIEVLKKNNRIIDVMFDGEHYTFNDRFMGMIAVAHRKDVCGHDFMLEYGNSNNYWESQNKADAEIAKKYIQKQETKYVKSTACTFDEVPCECNQKYYLTIGLNIHSGYDGKN